MDNDDIRALAKDLANFHRTTEKHELLKLGFNENFRSIWLGDVEALYAYGIIKRPSKRT